jgi:uncharacterized iron-regulated protein
MWKINIWGLILTLGLMLGLPLGLPLPVQAEPVQAKPVVPTFNAIPRDTVLAELVQARVIYLGETHDRAADHLAQFDIITALQAKTPLTIGMEMFQRPMQPALDDYLADRITETELLEKTAYVTQWGYDWAFYAPIVRYAKAQGIPIVALNAPSALVRQVGRKGIASLAADQQFIPPVAVLTEGVATSAPAYRQMLQETFDQAHQGKGNADRFERFFAAQVLWDETMADRVAETVTNQTAPMIVLVGQGHLVYGYGIPSRVKRRLPSVSQKIILLNPDPATATATGEMPIADLFWRNE